MEPNYAIYCLRANWCRLKTFFKDLLSGYKRCADKVNIYLAKNNIVSTFTTYDVIYANLPIAVISTYGKLYTHYDNLLVSVNSKEFKDAHPTVKDWELRFKSRKSMITSIFGVTVV